MARLSSAKLFLICTSAALLLTGCHATSTESFSDSTESVSPTGSTLHISKMGGDIAIDDAPDGATLHTMGGSIEVNKVEKSLKAETMGGNVTVHSANVSSLDVKTMGGNIDIGPAQASELHATTMGGNITAQTTGDGSIYLKSMGGNINLTIPKSSSAQIDIELEHRGFDNKDYTVTDNLGLQQQQSSSWDLWHFSPRKYVHATGAIGSSKNHIIIKAYGGNVTLNAE